MATDSSTNKSRLESFINYCLQAGWAVEAIQGAAANASAESHAFLENGDQYAASKYFDFCVYGGQSPYAGHDWYSQGAAIQGGAGAVGFFQWLMTNDASQYPAWNTFFADGNSESHLKAQLDWWFNSYGWSPGNDMSYTTTPGANSNISFDQFKTNANKNTAEELSNIFYVNFERGGSGQYAGHNWEGGIQTLIANWGIKWEKSGGAQYNPPTTSVSPPKKPSQPNSETKPTCIEYENTNPKPDTSKPEPEEKPEPNTGGGSKDTPSQSTYPNGDIAAIEAIIGQTVGWAGAFGECYGLAQWWVSHCGGNGQLMNSGSATGNPNLPNRPAGIASPGLPAAGIPFDYPWGSGAFAGFTAGTGTPPGGWRSGDIACVVGPYSYVYGHVLIVGKVNGDDFSHYDQNWGHRYVTKPAFTWQQGFQTSQWTSETGWVRPNNIPK